MQNYYGHDFNKKRYALFGQPVENSYSAHIYRQLFSSNSIPAKYLPVDAASPADIIQIMEEFDLAGCNITSPLKQGAMDLCDAVTEDAKIIGGVNTIIRKNGKLTGFNTDWEGVMSAINRMLKIFPDTKLQPDTASILIIGAGPAAAAAAFAIDKFYPKASLFIANRTNESAQKLAGKFKGTFLDMDKITAEDIRNFDLIIIASANKSSREVSYSIPMFYSRLPVDRMGQARWAPELTEAQKNRPPEWEHSLYDKIAEACGKKGDTPAIIFANYTNQKFFTAAYKQKRTLLSGVAWLVGQAVAAFEYFCENDEFCRAVELRDDYIDAKQREDVENNILLVGFSGSGKTAIAPYIAQKTGRTWVDTDAVIESMVGEHLHHFLTHVDEEFFRTIEANVIRQYASVPNCVIATGAGAICNPFNQQTANLFNCKVIYLYCDLKTCMQHIDDPISRPFLNGKSDRELEEMYNARKLIYFDQSDLIQLSKDLRF